jgi:type IV pilus assembly protein PilV
MRQRHRAAGFTMLEVMIAIVVIAFGLLGLAGLQAFSLKNNQSASLRVAATMLAADMVDRMKANFQGVIAGEYNKPNPADYGTAVPGCLTTSGCTPQELAQNDLREWADRIAAALPNANGIVCLDSTPNDGADQANPACDNAGATLYVIKIWWLDDRTQGNVAGARQRFVTAFNP